MGWLLWEDVFVFECCLSLDAVWADNREWVVAEHVAEHPGTRPVRWWEYDAPRSDDDYAGWDPGTAPKQRKRLGGVGQTFAEAGFAVKPYWHLGIPVMWLDAEDVRAFGRGIAVDPSDPPEFESQAAYLDRHALLTSAERRRLAPSDFDPEVIDTGS
jgi:hypothetical protein